MEETHSVDPSVRSPVVRDPSELLTPFVEAEKRPESFRIGAEVEKFGLVWPSRQPLAYEGPVSVLRIFDALEQNYGWVPEREVPGGPVIALERGKAKVTLEPGAQLELSGSALPDVHACVAEQQQHLEELAPVSKELGLTWLGIGFHPFARQADLPWVPKQRYRIMRTYLPKRGDGALDMMRRTCTVQANFDYQDERDAFKKVIVMLKLSPLMNAMLANSPVHEGRLTGMKSLRGDVWRRMDPQRSGLITSLWNERDPGYERYVNWALDAGMFLFKRGERVIENTGQSFRSFLEHGYQGERATLADFRLHLNTLFPEVRLKNTIEVRCVDSLPLPLMASAIALFTGILYDEQALDAAQAMTEGFVADAAEASRGDLIRQGLKASYCGQSAQQLAERLIEIAEQGLERRARLNDAGKDEREHLSPLRQLIERGLSPADALMQGSSDERALGLRIIEQCRM